MQNSSTSHTAKPAGLLDRVIYHPASWSVPAVIGSVTIWLSVSMFTPDQSAVVPWTHRVHIGQLESGGAKPKVEVEPRESHLLSYSTAKATATSGTSGVVELGDIFRVSSATS